MYIERFCGKNILHTLSCFSPKHVHLLCSGIYTLFVLGAQAAAFDGWVEAVHIARHNRQVVAKALRRITNLKLSQAFDWWRHQAEALQDAHARAGHIIARMQNQCLAAAFQAWTEAVLERKEAETRREQLVDAAVTRSNATILGQIFLVSSPRLCHAQHRPKQGTSVADPCRSLLTPLVGPEDIQCSLIHLWGQASVAPRAALYLVKHRLFRFVQVHGIKVVSNCLCYCLQAWMDQASQQVAMREQAASKLHRVAIGRLYSEWAAPSTCLGSTSGAEACMSAFMATWSHAVQVRLQMLPIASLTMLGRSNLAMVHIWHPAMQPHSAAKHALLCLREYVLMMPSTFTCGWAT